MRARPFLYKSVLYLITLFLIYPASPFLFKEFIDIKEPRYMPPISVEGKLRIRSDAMGDGSFGARRSGRRRHKGIDILGDINAPVYAAKSGIARTGFVPRGMGKYVKIFHPGGYETIYGHLNSIYAKNGAWIWQGEKIGGLGKTGNANYSAMKPHLHFEIRKNGRPEDPTPFITSKN